MINKRQIWREHTWTALSFPNRNKTILYDAVRKKYDIYDGLIDKEKPVEPPIPMSGMKTPETMREYDLSHLKAMCYIMGGAAAATLIIIISALIINKLV